MNSDCDSPHAAAQRFSFSFSSSDKRTLIRTFLLFSLFKNIISVLVLYLFAGVFRGFPLSQSTRLQAVDWDCGGHNPMLVIPVDTLSLLFLPFCLNVVFLSLPRSLPAALFRSLYLHKRSWQNHIPSSRSFSFNRLSGNKKSRHTNAYRLTDKRVDYPL